MSDVKRYHNNGSVCGNAVCSSGHRVDATDYAALQQQLEQAQGVIEKWAGKDASFVIVDLTKQCNTLFRRAEHAEARVRELERILPVDSTIPMRCGHNSYWRTQSISGEKEGRCMACRAEQAEAQLAAAEARIKQMAKSYANCCQCKSCVEMRQHALADTEDV